MHVAPQQAVIFEPIEQQQQQQQQVTQQQPESTIVNEQVMSEAAVGGMDSGTLESMLSQAARLKN